MHAAVVAAMLVATVVLVVMVVAVMNRLGTSSRCSRSHPPSTQRMCNRQMTTHRSFGLGKCLGTRSAIAVLRAWAVQKRIAMHVPRPSCGPDLPSPRAAAERRQGQYRRLLQGR